MPYERSRSKDPVEKDSEQTTWIPCSYVSPLNECKIETRRVTGISKEDFTPFSEDLWAKHAVGSTTQVTQMESLVTISTIAFEKSFVGRYDLYTYIAQLKRGTSKLTPRDDLVFYQEFGKTIQSRKLIEIFDFEDALRAPRLSSDAILIFLFDDAPQSASDHDQATYIEGKRPTRLCPTCQIWANAHGTYLCNDLVPVHRFRERAEVVSHASFHQDVRSVVRASGHGCFLCNFLLKTSWDKLGGSLKSELPGFLDTRIESLNTGSGLTYKTYYVDLTLQSNLNLNLRLGNIIKLSAGNLRLDIFTDQGDPIAKNVPNRPISDDPISAFCMETARNWISDCIKGHLPCSSSSTSKMPKRVIDLGSDTRNILPKLVETTPGHLEDWVALSYCWGKDATFLQTTKANKEFMCHGLELSVLPRTYLDAFKVTRALGYRYIWIDALCIVQDDDSDKKREIEHMHNTYRNAVLTLAIDAANSVEEGFLFKRSEFEFASKSICIPYSNHVNNLHGHFYFRDPLREGTGLMSPWTEESALDSRGWSLQENILSPRTLHFGGQQLFWDCQSKYCSEATPSDDLARGWRQLHDKYLFLDQQGLEVPLVNMPMDFMSRSDWVLNRWYKIISNYGNRSFSVEKDVISGIAGIAEEIATQSGIIYKAGLWQQDMHRGLLWRTSECRRVSEYYRAPSWSWLSVPPPIPGDKTKLQYYSWFSEPRGFEDSNPYKKDVVCAEVCEISIATENGDSSTSAQPVHSSFLRLRSAWSCIQDWSNSRRSQFWCNSSEYEQEVYWQARISYGILDDPYPFPGQIVCDLDSRAHRSMLSSGTSNLSFLVIMEVPRYASKNGERLLWCLILRRQEREDEEIFTRIGIARIPRGTDFWEPNWTNKEIKIY